MNSYDEHYTMINPTNTFLFNQDVRRRQNNVGQENISQSHLRELWTKVDFFTNFNLGCVTRNKETIDLA